MGLIKTEFLIYFIGIKHDRQGPNRFQATFLYIEFNNAHVPRELVYRASSFFVPKIERSNKIERKYHSHSQSKRRRRQNSVSDIGIRLTITWTVKMELNMTL
jgi:hypothetical protein